MKKYNFNYKVFTFIIGILIFSNVVFGQKLWIPEDIMYVESEENIEILRNKNWQYIGTTVENKLVNIQSPTIKISCKCESGSSACNPFAGTGPQGSTAGCAGSCTKCIMTQTTVKDKNSYIMNSGGFYNPNLKTRLLKPGENSASVFSELCDLPEFQEDYNIFMKNAYNGKEIQNIIINEDGSFSAPDGYSVVGIYIMGRALISVVPNEYIIKKYGENYFAEAKSSCSCTSGTCSKKSVTIPFTGSVTWCEGNCSGTCTLTISNKLNSNSIAFYNF